MTLPVVPAEALSAPGPDMRPWSRTKDKTNFFNQGRILSVTRLEMVDLQSVLSSLSSLRWTEWVAYGTVTLSVYGLFKFARLCFSDADLEVSVGIRFVPCLIADINETDHRSPSENAKIWSV